MSRKDFSLLLQKYLDDQCTPSEKAVVEGWFNLLDDGNERWQQLSSGDLNFIEQQLWNRLQQAIHGTANNGGAVSTPKKVFRLSIAFRLAAAVIILAVGAALFFQYVYLKPQRNTTVTASGWLKKINQTTEPFRLVLEDGSTLQLSPGAIVYYPEHFTGHKREIQLEGTAYFQIAKDSSRPFYVHAQDLVTRVLGTSFWVIYDNVKKQSAVEVVTGKVAVYQYSATDKTTPQTEGVLLKPNEKVIFNKAEEVLVTTLVDAPLPVTQDVVKTEKNKSDFIYDETPVTKVVADLESEYGISIILGSDEMNNLVFTGNLSSLDYYTRLKAICKSLGAVYEIKANRILIQRK